MSSDKPYTWLDEDSEIASQRYAIVSFVHPDRILQQKNTWFFSKFRQQYVVDTRIECYEKFMAFIAQKYGHRVDDLMHDFIDFKKFHENKPDFSYGDSEEAWLNFMFKNEASLQKQFDADNAFQTNVSGIKIRKVFSNIPEAESGAKKFIGLDNGAFRTAIVEVGKWIPINPGDHLLENVKSSNEELNTLMEKYQENQVQAQQVFRQEVEFKKKKAIEENLKRKADSDRQSSIEDSKDEIKTFEIGGTR
jgi:hypothetical protein